MRSTSRVARSAVATIKSGLTSTTDAESFKRLTAEQGIAVWKLRSPDEQERWRGPLLLKIIAARKAGRDVVLPDGLREAAPATPSVDSSIAAKIAAQLTRTQSALGYGPPTDARRHNP